MTGYTDGTLRGFHRHCMVRISWVGSVMGYSLWLRVDGFHKLCNMQVTWMTALGLLQRVGYKHGMDSKGMAACGLH